MLYGNTMQCAGSKDLLLYVVENKTCVETFQIFLSAGIRDQTARQGFSVSPYSAKNLGAVLIPCNNNHLSGINITFHFTIYTVCKSQKKRIAHFWSQYFL